MVSLGPSALLGGLEGRYVSASRKSEHFVIYYLRNKMTKLVSMISRVVDKILEYQNGACLFVGKIIEVSRVSVTAFHPPQILIPRPIGSSCRFYMGVCTNCSPRGP